ncbi:DUF2459 domain-containing protein [Tenacibaculum amylolyticum]|uniref:DUF2459 domain-containing protein n=1 Tax=Tenacibaculum amylolyticum TaxID=104269 RepID=UPI0038939312
MFIIQKLIKYITYFLSSILVYLVFAILISFITVNKEQAIIHSKQVFLSSNGIHLSLIIPSQELSEELKKDLYIPSNASFVRFGWGDENFYMNTPTWNDFKLKYALGALFLNNSTLLEVKPIRYPRDHWKKVPVNDTHLQKLNAYVAAAFQKNSNDTKIVLQQNMYPNSQLYKANGSYSPIKTCNTWVNTAFKESGLKASYWTLFDFGLLNKYR